MTEADIAADIAALPLLSGHICATMVGPGVLSTPRPRTTLYERIDMAKRTCSVDGCDEFCVGRGWCSKHYKRWEVHGDPLHVHQYPPAIERLLSHVTVDDNGCWITDYKPTETGYVSFYVDGVALKGHRFAYQQLVGPVPEGLVLDHLCRVRHCVNPAHLEPVTDRENFRRGMAPNAILARANVCRHGHSLENAYVSPRGQRACRVCRNLKYARRKARP